SRRKKKRSRKLVPSWSCTAFTGHNGKARSRSGRCTRKPTTCKRRRSKRVVVSRAPATVRQRKGPQRAQVLWTSEVIQDYMDDVVSVGERPSAHAAESLPRRHGTAKAKRE